MLPTCIITVTNITIVLCVLIVTPEGREWGVLCKMVWGGGVEGSRKAARTIASTYMSLEALRGQ